MSGAPSRYSYARAWDPVRREAVGVGPEEEVRQAAQKAGTTYVVVAYDEDQVRCGYMLVDETAQRYEVSYTAEEPLFPAEMAGGVLARAVFVPGGQGRLFEASFAMSPREPGDPDAEAHPFMETHEHSPDGTMVHVEEFQVGDITRTEFHHLDESCWYLPIPERGEWGPLFMKNAGGY